MRPSIDLSLGEPQYAPPSIVSEIARAALDKGFMHYAPPGGLPKLRELLASKVMQKNRLPSVSTEHVSVTNGASMAITSALMAVCTPGDYILCPTPCFPGYRRIIESLKLQILPYTVSNNSFIVDWPDDPLKPRVVLWNSPHNPTGAVASETTIRSLLDYCSSHKVTIISDEVYEDIVFEGQHLSPGSFDSDVEVFSVYSFSKSYAMTGWRIGYLVSPSSIARKVERIHYAAAMSVPMLSQIAALGVLRTSSDAYFDETRKLLHKNRQQIGITLARSGLHCKLPDGAFYFWVDISSLNLDSRQFVDLLYREENILLGPGEAFVGTEPCSHIRLHFAIKKDVITEFCSRWINFFQRLTNLTYKNL